LSLWNLCSGVGYHLPVLSSKLAFLSQKEYTLVYFCHNTTPAALLWDYNIKQWRTLQINRHKKIKYGVVLKA
jgi:hypothetical protein